MFFILILLYFSNYKYKKKMIKKYNTKYVIIKGKRKIRTKKRQSSMLNIYNKMYICICLGANKASFKDSVRLRISPFYDREMIIFLIKYVFLSNFYE